RIHSNDIYLLGNFMFGLPEDNLETMQKTLQLAMDLNCEFVNFYCAMAYPGSKLYEYAIKQNLPLPESWLGYSQHSYETLPLPTKYLSAKEVLKFRDEAFYRYFTNQKYLELIEKKFGYLVVKHLKKMVNIKLKRKLLE
ncbi:MAG: B12-binding domain-containing radical SAM protein, partial [Endomicrobia bacterium]|nr:B12-binding domain-containing radical SAM protein [Endomicrobiia bacterium]